MPYNEYGSPLMHYGIKGMKWGVRKQYNTHNKNYSDKQRKNDRAFYGSRGEKRINKKLNQGYGLRGARHFEVERQERNERRKKMVGKTVKTISKAATTVGSAYLYDQIFRGGMGTRAVTRLAKDSVSIGAQFTRAAVQAYRDTHPRYEV